MRIHTHERMASTAAEAPFGILSQIRTRFDAIRAPQQPEGRGE
jgi:hypothetical protein